MRFDSLALIGSPLLVPCGPLVVNVGAAGGYVFFAFHERAKKHILFEIKQNRLEKEQSSAKLKRKEEKEENAWREVVNQNW